MINFRTRLWLCYGLGNLSVAKFNSVLDDKHRRQSTVIDS